MKILVKAYLANNLGDDLMLNILFNRYPNYTFHVIGLNECNNRGLRKFKNVKSIKGKFNIIRSIPSFDAFIIIGGSMFQDTPESIKDYTNDFYLCKILKFFKKRFYIMGCNIGPFITWGCLPILTKLFKLADFISVRDEESYNFLKSINLENKALYPDIVFSLPDQNLGIHTAQKKTLGISIINLASNLEYKQAYIDKISEIIKVFKNKYDEIILFAFESGVQNDEIVIDQIINSLNCSKITKKTYNGSIRSFLNAFKKCDLIIGTRFHSIVLALKYGIKFIPIIYNQKAENLLNDLEYKSLRIQYKEMKKVNAMELLQIAEGIESFKLDEKYIIESENHYNYLKI